MIPLPSHIIYLSSEQILKYHLSCRGIYSDEKNMINISAINLETIYLENVHIFIK